MPHEHAVGTFQVVPQQCFQLVTFLAVLMDTVCTDAFPPLAELLPVLQKCVGSFFKG